MVLLGVLLQRECCQLYVSLICPCVKGNIIRDKKHIIHPSHRFRAITFPCVNCICGSYYGVVCIYVCMHVMFSYEMRVVVWWLVLWVADHCGTCSIHKGNIYIYIVKIYWNIASTFSPHHRRKHNVFGVRQYAGLALISPYGHYRDPSCWFINQNKQWSIL